MKPARRLTLTEDVYGSVQALIMDHAVAPGARINIDALARQLEVSPTPVREALARLEADGLVRKRPLAGYTAAPLLTREEFEELVEMRLILEPPAASRAASVLPASDVDRLRAEADLPDPQPGIAAFTAQDARFHHLVAELSGNRMLHEAVVRLRSHLHLFRLHFPPAHYGISAEEHHRVVDAIAASDPERAAGAMRAHITAARERHLPYFGRTT
ncbi:GntR family transcriptional regulator [Phytohabitans sp. ZYX-F-186]|uniref:GntR family transcriptional regulator n=1 Tax=Phytohabitans maris TaxID=3071409 RepID=A0ABU0ZLD0_9ACTN|nr:GntR family transcriptional regulator [Phytohabitans sp. ZYX-F-186]MDQ7907856.1 GntR family transcriptional regulator [Phytohabitans sp. ZYX-F-186]